MATLLFLLISSLAASSLVVSHQHSVKRDREAQLLFVGDQYKKAITSYYNTVPPGGARALPRSLDNLLEDHRFATPKQHLRRLYVDPFTGTADWQLVTSGHGVIGVYSRFQGKPLKITGFSPGYEHFERAQSYSEWVFAVNP